MSRLTRPVVLLLLLAATVAAGPAAAQVTPVATDDAAYELFGRVFPDPHGCLREGAVTPKGVSPWAKGNVCATDYITYQQAVDGIRYLQRRLPGHVTLVRVDGESAGVPRSVTGGGAFQRDRKPLYLAKVTNADSAVPETEREHFVSSLSVHGLERAGVEGGLRVLEDLATWSACEDGADLPACALEGPFPRRLVETGTERWNPTVGEALDRAVVYFMLTNPDGWVAGERSLLDTRDGAPDTDHQVGGAFTRGNGHGVDLNRDWPTIGHSFKPYSPGSEPETKAFSRALGEVRAGLAAGRFAGGIDLHNQLASYAFSYTMHGGSQRDVAKNADQLATSLRAWEDQTAKLCWSPLVLDANCDGDGTNDGCTGGQFCVADEWGTTTDAFSYAVTGGVGDWIESPAGLGGIGLSNEMALSIVWQSEMVQTHIDGNKSLIASQIAALLEEREARLVPSGRVGYVFDPTRLRVDGAPRKDQGGLPAQPDESVVLPCTACGLAADGLTYAFEVRDGFGNGGLSVEMTPPQVGGQPITAEFSVERFVEGTWQRVVSSARGAGLATSASMIATIDDPEAGRYRVRFAVPLPGRLTLDFDPVTAEISPGQRAIDASSMDFFAELEPFAGGRLERVAVDEVGGTGVDVLIVTNRLGDAAHLRDDLGMGEAEIAAYFDALKSFASRGGTLVLTDAALQVLPALGLAEPAQVKRATGVAGFYFFDIGSGLSYDDPQRFPLARGIDLPGKAEQAVGQLQSVESTPLGYSPQIGLDPNPAQPFWGVERAAWQATCGLPDCVTALATNRGPNVSVGEARVGNGRVRIIGSLLPDPVFAPDANNDHREGVASHALTWAGYAVFANAIGAEPPVGR